MKKLLKRTLALLMSLALVLGGVGVIPAATTEASSTGYTELTFSDFGIEDGKSFVDYESFTVQDSNITTLVGTAFTGKVTMTALDQWVELGGGATASSRDGVAAFGVHSSGPTVMFRNFKTSTKYENGTGAKDTEYLIRITFDAVDGGTEINCYLNDIEGEPVATYTVTDSTLLVPRLGLAYATVTSVYVGQEEMSVDSVLNFSTSNGDWRFNFNMNGTWPTTGDFDKYTSTNVTVTIKNASGENLATVESGSLENYKHGSYWMLCVWGVYTGSNAPAVGDTITISSGQLAYKEDTTKIVNFAEETVLEYDGENWSVYEEPIEYTYTDITIAGSTTFNVGQDGNGNPYWDIYLGVEGTLPGTDWQTQYNEVVLMVDDTEIEGLVKRANGETQLNLFIWGTEMSTTPEVGTRFTLKAGQSLGYNVSDGVSIGSGINITTDYVVEWNGSEWAATTEWTNIVVNGLNINTAVSGEIWQAYFYTDAVLPGEAWGIVDNQQESYTFDADINGTVTTLKVRKAGDKLLYVEIPIAMLPENTEATVTFKAGQYQSNVQSIGYHITEDFVFYTNAYGWTTVADAVVSDVTFTLDATSPSGLSEKGFVLDTNIDDGVTPNADWTSRIYPAYEKGVTDDKQTLYFAGKNGVFKNGVYQAVNLPMVKLYSQTYYVAIGDVELSATAEDYYTISGVFIDRTTGKFIEYEPITVKWNGSEWAISTEWTNIAINGLNINTAVSGEIWQAYFYTDAVLPGEAWGVVDNQQESYTFDADINGTATTLKVRKAGDKLLYVEIPTAQLPENAEATVTFKAGQYQSNVQSIGYNLTEDFVFYTNAYGWTTVADAVVSDVTFTLDATSPSGLTANGFVLDTNIDDGVTADSGWTSRIYPAYEKGVTDDKQTLYFAGENGVFKNGVYQAVKLPMVKLSSQTYYVALADVDLAATTAGDYYTISGVFIDGTTGKFIEYEPITVEWKGTEWGAPTEWTSIVVNGLNINTAVSGEKWQAYFYTDAVLPGEAWGIVDNQQESYTFDADINGTATTLKVRKAGDKLLYVEIPTTKLPENTEATVTFKAGQYQSNVQSIGYNLTKDFVFYTNAYGWTTVADAVVSDVTFTLEADSPSGLTANGFVLHTNVNDGVTPNSDWSARIYPAYEKGVTEDKQTLYFAGENGVFKNGVYQAVNLPMVKLYSQTYYVALADVDLAATTGDYYTISGVFIDGTTGKFIEYEPITVKWNGEAWEKIGTILGDKGVLHDVNADGELDVKDLVRMKRYLADATTAINAAQKDINFSGATDNADAISLRKILIGLIRYDAEGLVYEVPVYDNDLVIERMAFSSPAVGTLNDDGSFASQLSDAEIDAAFQKYKAAGLTLLNSEHVAAYKDQAFTSEYNEPLRVYLEAAERNGLGVIVSHDYLNAILRAEDLASYSNWQSVVDHAISNMSGYESFRGFMLSDELTNTYLSNYQTIAGYLHTNYPELILHTSQLGASSASGMADETTYREYVWNFAQVIDSFTYNLYPLHYDADAIFGTILTEEWSVEQTWYNTLQYVANEVKEQDYAFTTGITLQSCKLASADEYTYQYAPTQKADIGFQVYTAMAYGMQEFNFFTYEDHFSDTTVSNAMADNTEVYAAVQAVNTEVDKFAHVFKAFSWKDTLDIADGSSASTTLSSRLASASVTGARVFVGCMKDDDGFDGYMVANADGPRTAGTATVTLTFNSAVEAVVYTNGEPQRVTLTDGVCTVTVGAGEGVFVIPIAGVTSTDAADYCDFIVDVESGAEPVVLQITDTQIMYAEGARTEDRLSEVSASYWAKANKDARCYSYLTELVTKTNPDLILVTGDLVYGEFDDSGEAFTDFVTYMEGLKIPWAPVFGNHEAETALGIDAYCDQLEAAEYCLFKQRELTGNGNYTVGIRQDGELKRVFFMLDSNGCGAASEASLANGHTVRTVGFGSDQIEWYTETAKTITGYSRNTKLSFAFHIQLQAFADAYAKYGYTNDDTSIDNPIHIDLLTDKAEGDFGYLGRKLKDGWDTEYVVWNGLKELGVDSIFVGHEHCNSASVVYEGIRCQYGQKSSTYDRANFVDTTTGVITGDACLDMDSTYVPLIGGTVLPLSSDGSFNNPYIYLCENAGGTINWDDYKEVEGDVNGLQYGTELTSSGVSVAKAEIGDAIAWECVATSQGKVFVDTRLLDGKTKFTFSVYIPEESTATMDLSDKPLFCIRVKTETNTHPSFGSCNGGYVSYSTTVEDENHKLVYGQWQTFTVDLTEMSETCTEFAFNIAAGNTIYLKDIVIE